jgi:hypothetical protein
MAYKHLGYHNLMAWPARLGVGINSDDATSTNLTIDAQDEEVHFIGQLLLPQGVASVEWNTNTTLGFSLSTTTLANASTTLRMGVQDVDATTGVPGRGDGTFDCYADYVGGTDTLTGGTWNTVTMETGTKTCNAGDLIAICFKLVSRGGSDSIAISCSGSVGMTPARPLVVSSIGSGFVGRSVIPPVAINFNGTWATLAGAIAFKARTNTNFTSTSNPNERGSLFKLPFACTVYGAVLRGLFCASSATVDVLVYSDPLGTPAAISGLTLTVDGDTLYAGNVGDVILMFHTPTRLAANTLYALILKPNANVNTNICTVTAHNTDLMKLFYGGENWSYCARNGGSGAFTETNTMKQVAQLLIGDIETGPQATYAAGVI